MRLIAGCIILCIILLGYISWLYGSFKVNIYLAPAIAVTGITAALFFSGLLNVMTAAFFCISGLGIFLFIRYFFGIRWHEILKEEYFSFLILALIFGYVIYYLKGAVYGDGDTMTHWALIAREMCETNRLPNFTTQVVTYQSYPPATACWIWFAARFTGFSEAKSLLAQAGWLFSLVISSFALNRNHRKVFSLAAGLLVLFLMFFEVGIDNLRVDIILPAAFLAGASVCFAEHENKNLPLILVPFLIVVTAIKNSGILFAAYLAVVYAFLPVKETTRLFTRLQRLLLALAVSGGTIYLWKKHTDMVYKNAGDTRHAVSVSAMKHIFGDRTADDIREILTMFLKRWFSLNESAEWVGFLIFIIVLLAAFTVAKKTAVLTGAGVFAGYACYKVLLLAMYLVNLPGEEAKRIPAYTRYQGTYTVIVLFAALYLFSLLAEKYRGLSAAAAAGAVILAFVLSAASSSFTRIVVRPDYESAGCHRKLAALVRNEEELWVGQRVLVYTRTPFSWYYARYTFHNQGAFGSDDIEKVRLALTDNTEGFERVVILDHDENVDQLLAEFGYEVSAGPVIIKC